MLDDTGILGSDTYRIAIITLDSHAAGSAERVEALDEQRAKVAESESKGHGKRLEQRQHALGRVEQELKDTQNHLAHLEAQVEALGRTKARADRDFR